VAADFENMDELTVSKDFKPQKPLAAAVLEQVAITSVALGAVVPLIAFDVVVNDLASAIARVPIMIFRDSPLTTAPAVIMFFCVSGLLRNFVNPETSRAAKIMRAVLAGFVLVVSTNSSINGLIAFLAGAAAWYASCRLGLAMRRAMPPTFRYHKTLGAAFVGYLPILSFLALIIFGLISIGPPANSSYGAIGTVTPSYLAFVTAFIGLMLAFPAFLIAKSARTGEGKPLVLLAVLLNSPMILALIALPLAALLAPDIAPYHGHFLLACLPMPIAAILMTAAGAWTGAKSNALSHHLKLRQNESTIKLKS
jgi:hypothetical protein